MSEADLYGEFRAILPARGQLQPAADWARGRVTAVVGPMLGVALGDAGGHEPLDQLATKILRRPAERLLDPRAGIDDSPAPIDGYDRIRASIEHRLGA